MQEKSIQGIGEKQCCGCGACRQVCPQGCIDRVENQRGFILPSVDESKCVNCGLCRKVCPEINIPEKSSTLSAYIAKTAEFEIQKQSTSGGIFTLLAEEVLKHNGVVYGCSWTDDLKAIHVRVDSSKGLAGLRQSKYIQSDTDNTFGEAKKDLKAGRTVLYCGTGCQLVGLRNVVGDNDGLILVEVACHGVPSPGLFREYIKWIEKNSGKNVASYQFRNRKKHKKGEHYQLRVKYVDGSEEYRYSSFDPYYASFIAGKTLRETCYTCKYKGKERVGDILLADFWGAEKEHPRFESADGASAVVILSPKAQKLFDGIKSRIVYADSSWDKVIAHNRSLIEQAGRNHPYEKIDIEALKPKVTVKTLIKVYTPEKIKYLLKRI